jgi:hypothetical protein
MRTGERNAEQDEPRHRERDAATLERRERHLPVTREHHCEDADAAGRGGLDEREGRKRKREHVQQPPDCLDAEPEQPAALAEQEPRRAKRPRRERRQLRRDTGSIR